MTKHHYQPGDIVLVGSNKNGEVRHEVIKYTKGSRHMTVAPLTKLGRNIERQFMVAVDCVQPLSQR